MPRKRTERIDLEDQIQTLTDQLFPLMTNDEGMTQVKNNKRGPTTDEDDADVNTANLHVTVLINHVRYPYY